MKADANPFSEAKAYYADAKFYFSEEKKKKCYKAQRERDFDLRRPIDPYDAIRREAMK